MSQVQTNYSCWFISVIATLVGTLFGSLVQAQTHFEPVANNRCPAAEMGCREESFVEDVNENGNEIPSELMQAYDVADKERAKEQWDLKKMIPNDLSSGQDPNSAMSRIADKSFNTWYDESIFKQSALGQSVDRASKSLQMDAALGAPGETQHKFNMGIDLFQSKASLKYEGFAKAELFYQARDSSAGLQVTKKLDATKDLVIGETMRASDAYPSSEVKWRWNW